MPLLCRKALFGFFLLFLFACKKDNLAQITDNLIEQPEQLSELKAEVSAAGYKFIEIQWNAVNNTHFKAVTYSVYLNDQKVIDGLTTTKYSLINLTQSQKYTIKVIASTKEGKQVEQSIAATTLGNTTENEQIFYQEYRIHSYSRLTGTTGLQKLPDGGHLFVRLLQHDGFFDNETFKIIFFKIDRFGKMLWYRLLSTKSFNLSVYGEVLLTSHKAGEEGILFMQNSAVKFASGNGEILAIKNYGDRIGSQIFQSSFYSSPQQIILGTQQGNLLAINPDDLSIIWHKTNTDRLGWIVAINADSKKNIYYIFRDQSDSYTKIRVHKCSPNGDFIKDFLFDGTLPNEYNLGFWMTSLLVDEQDNLYLFGRNSSYSYLRYFKFSTDGTLIKKNQTSDYLNADKAFFNAKGEIIVVGQVDGGGLNTYAGLYTFDKDMNIKSKRYYQDIKPHILKGITGNADGSYNIFLNYMQTYTYDNPNFVYIKTDTDGKM
ncbi:hypothetical protein ACS5PU_12230 [Pedobacter sp. GSP4]|uniref:fibronectin type III domain-containing protein n=1 Tax=Pedobacter sp. GSP4 TaxID=3453716 RepID=UPI003EE8AAB6